MISFSRGTLVLRDRFRLVRELGEGGMGVVWEVEELASGDHLAIKFVKEEESSALAIRRLYREAEAASAISHPNIVRVLEVVEDNGAAAIVMELLAGESLGARLARGPLTVGQAAAVLGPVVSALRAAHAAGVIHRDLKPDNVFLVTKPTGATDVCVLDFGVAKQVHLPADSLTVTGSIVGTPMYMSPEQAAGERGLDARTDVWSLAVIAFECLSGTTPVNGDNYGQVLAQLIRGEIVHLATIRPALPADLLAFVDGALVPRDRRSFDFDAVESMLARHADATIDPVPTHGNAGPVSDGRIRRALDLTQLATSSSMSVTPKSTLPRMMWAGLGLAAGVFAGSIAYLQLGAQVGPSPLAVVDTQPPPTTTTATATASPVVSAATTDAAMAPPMASAKPVPSTEVVARTRADAGAASLGGDEKRKPAASARPNASPASSARVATPSSSSSVGPERLPGGVGGNVPF